MNGVKYLMTPSSVFGLKRYAFRLVKMQFAFLRTWLFNSENYVLFLLYMLILLKETKWLVYIWNDYMNVNCYFASRGKVFFTLNRARCIIFRNVRDGYLPNKQWCKIVDDASWSFFKFTDKSGKTDIRPCKISYSIHTCCFATISIVSVSKLIVLSSSTRRMNDLHPRQTWALAVLIVPSYPPLLLYESKNDQTLSKFSKKVIYG